jgi:hypothetical protein
MGGADILTMECLQNYIGIKGCGAPTPPSAEGAFSGLYVNQLPGISTEVIDGIADDEQETFLGVWEDVNVRVMQKFALAVKAELNKCYRITDKTVVECLVCADKDSFAVALWYLFGVELMIERNSSTRINWLTTIDLDRAEKLKVEYYTEYEAALKDAVNSINPADSDCVTGCLECNDAVRFKMQTP